MNFVPMALILAVIGCAWPNLLPGALAYFIIGGGIGAFFAWAARKHPDKTMVEWAKPMVIYNLYAWPLAILVMLINPMGARK